MKHVFLINPIAGDGKTPRQLRAKIESICSGRDLNWLVYETQAPGDARRYVAESFLDETVRFYVVGGDGTLNEAVNGMMVRGSGELGLIPCGSGDDFARFFPDRHLFLDIERQLEAESKPIDLLRADGVYCINMCNVGLDADTAANVHRFTRFLPGSIAYVVALIDRALHKLGKGLRATVDGETFEGTFVLGSFANGKSCGGGFFSSPRAVLDDGLMEVGLIKPLSRLKFIRLVGRYKRGDHMDDASFAPILIYRRAKQVQLCFDEKVNFCIDGEIFPKQNVDIEVIPQAMRLIIPK